MDNLQKLKRDLEKKRARIDSELKKLEVDLSKVAEKPSKKAEPVVQPVMSNIVKQMPKLKLFESIRITRKLVAGSALIVLIILLVGTVSYIILTRPLTKDEFVSRVQGCKSGTYLDQVDHSLVKYTTKNCIVTREVTYVSPSEPQAVKVLLDGKRMTCEYRKGEFDFRHINYFMLDIDSCWGELKDILLELQGYKLAVSTQA